VAARPKHTPTGDQRLIEVPHRPHHRGHLATSIARDYILSVAYMCTCIVSHPYVDLFLPERAALQL
jgi:hypothetical protein